MAEYTEKDLRLAREAANLPRWKAAQELGVHPDTLARWESGEQAPSPEDVGRMERVYNSPGMWYRWMWSNHDSFRERLPRLPEIDTSPLASAVGIRQEMEDVQQRQGKHERDLLDGRIDDRRAYADYIKELSDLLAVILYKVMMERR